MSYDRFLDDMNDAMVDVKENNPVAKDFEEHRALLDKAREIVFTNWLGAGRFCELVEWFLESCDAGGGDKYLEPLNKSLVESGDKELIDRLWKGVVKTREKMLAASTRDAKRQGTTGDPATQKKLNSLYRSLDAARTTYKDSLARL